MFSQETDVNGSVGPDRPDFAMAMRGYDRRQVDEHLQVLSAKLAAAQREREQEKHRAVQAENELRSALDKLKQGGEGPPESQEGFGFRVEKVLRMAEQEAIEVRARAAREAAGLIEKARADSEAHRHDVEQSLIAKAAAMDQEVAQRQAQLHDWEQQLTEQGQSARAEADQVLETAERRADELRKEVQAAADELRARAENAVRQQREAGERELRRLGALHDGVRAELARLQKLLVSELGTSPDQAEDLAS